MLKQEARTSLEGSRPLLLAEPGRHQLTELAPDLHDVELDEHEQGLRLLILHHVELLDELLVVHVAAPVRVQHAIHDLQVVIVNVHGPECAHELGVVVEAIFQFRKREAPGLVLIQLFAELIQSHARLLAHLLCLEGFLLDRILSSLHRPFHNDAHEQIQRRQRHRHHDSDEKYCGSRRLFHDRGIQLTPSLTNDELLAQG
mmetsp:Transcript_4476/g.12939  ORF Transcript_4476/g.12939 Transcript_4476/m.12939 type:complete len:201 (+) Transcript_4476:655-1257(+)